MSIQSGQVLRPRYRRGPVLLQELHPPFDMGLLLRRAHQAEKRLKRIVVGQSLVTLMQRPLATHEHLTHHGLWVIPPHLMRHAAKEAEALHHAVQDRLGALARQGNGERTIRVSPGEQQDRDLAAAVRKVDVDVAKVGLEPLAGVVVQRDEGLALRPMFITHVEADALVAARVTVFGLETTKDLGGRMPLLARGRCIRLHHGVDQRLEGIQHRGHRAASIRVGFGLAEDLTDLAARVMKPTRQLADAHLVDAMGTSDLCISVHLDHPPPPVSWRPRWCTSLQEVVEGGTVFDEDFCPGVGPFSTRVTTHRQRGDGGSVQDGIHGTVKAFGDALAAGHGSGDRGPACAAPERGLERGGSPGVRVACACRNR